MAIVNGNRHFLPLVTCVDMGAMMLTVIPVVHQYKDPVEHADGRHLSSSQDLLKNMVKTDLPVRQFQAERCLKAVGVKP